MKVPGIGRKGAERLVLELRDKMGMPSGPVSYTHLDVYKRQAYMFTRKGVVIVPKGSHTEDTLLEVVLDVGAEEINDLGEAFEIVSEASDFVEVRKALQAAGIDYDSAEATFIPSVEVPLNLEGARKMMRVIDALEDSDDVQNVYANGDISDEVLAQLDEE